MRIIRRGTGSVVTWRRAQMVLLSAQGMPVARIAEAAFTSEDRVRDVIHNFNTDGFDSLYPKYKGGRPKKFTLPERREIKKIAKSRPAEHDLPFSTWSLTKLADFLVAEGVVDDISHEGLRVLLREEGVSFQRLKTWKAFTDPDYAAKKARVEHLYAIADGEVDPRRRAGSGLLRGRVRPLNLMPRPGPAVGRGRGKHKDPGREPRREARHLQPHGGVRHLFAALDLGKDKLFGHIKPIKPRARFLEFCRYLRSLYPPETRIAIVCDNFTPHLTTRKDRRVGTWARANNVEIAYTPTNSSWLNRLLFPTFLSLPPSPSHRGPVHSPAVLRAGRYRPSQPKEQASMIRRYIIWRPTMPKTNGSAGS